MTFYKLLLFKIKVLVRKKCFSVISRLLLGRLWKPTDFYTVCVYHSAYSLCFYFHLYQLLSVTLVTSFARATYKTKVLGTSTLREKPDLGFRLHLTFLKLAIFTSLGAVVCLFDSLFYLLIFRNKNFDTGPVSGTENVT